MRTRRSGPWFELGERAPGNPEVPFDESHSSPGCTSIAIGVYCRGHGIVCAFIIHQPRCSLHDSFFVQPDELDGSMTLVIWRKRPGADTARGVEEDNLILDEWFTKQGYSSKDCNLDLIYVNGDNNLENLKTPNDTWKVRLIEEDFLGLMFAMERT